MSQMHRSSIRTEVRFFSIHQGMKLKFMDMCIKFVISDTSCLGRSAWRFLSDDESVPLTIDPRLRDGYWLSEKRPS
jgi:hypothetical protein